MDLLSLLLVYLSSGALAGLIAGLLGVGGGIVVVPVLIIAFESQVFSSDILTHLAVGSSLATIVVTSVSSIYSHHRQGSVSWSVWSQMLPGIIIGSVIGVYGVIQISGEVLQQLIGVLALLVAGKMLYKSQVVSNKELPRPTVFVSMGAVIGAISAVFGIGGGTMSVPFLSRYRLAMVKVIGTSAAIGLPIALSGMMANIVFGWNASELPEGATGFVYWPAVAGIVCASVVFARVGARLAHRVPEQRLKQLFSILLSAVGIKFLFF